MKIGFLITARLKSKRLPLKILKDLNGKTVIERIIDRAKQVKGISEVVLCTSTNSQDTPLIEIAEGGSIQSFRGDEEDVLKRLLDAARLFNLDYFIGITADNPLMTIEYSNRIVDEIRKNESDFIKIKGLPIGAATYGANIKALETVCRIKTIVDTEIWGYLIDRPELFDVKTIQVKGMLNKPELRFTLDYHEDYKMLNDIYANVPFKNTLNLQDAINYLDRNPDIAKINKDCIQLCLDKSVKNEIDRVYYKEFEEIKRLKDEIYNR